MSSFLSGTGSGRRLRIVVTGLAVGALLSTGAQAPVWAAEPVPSAAAAAAAAAEPTRLATDGDKYEAAAAIGVNPTVEMLIADDQAFVLALWRVAKADSFVQAAALRAYTSEDSQAAYDFIKTGIFVAAADDARAEIAAAQAKALRRSVAVTVGLDPADTALIDLSDKDFIFAVWQRAKEGSHVQAAARAAVATGTTQADWTAFLTTGAAAARQQDVEDELRDKDEETAARIRAAALAAAKKSLLQLLLLPVTQELVDAPNRQYVLHILNNAKGTEVKLAAQAAINAPDAVEQALSDFIFTGGAAANKKDEDAAAAKELANYRSQVTAIRDKAKVDGQQPNLVAAADQALTANTHLALQTFLLKGQDEARAKDKDRLAATVHTLTALHSGMCLAVSGASTTAGENVIQWTCNGGPEQDWRIRARADGYYEVRNDHSKQCMGIGGGSKENAARIIQWTCRDATLDQQWLLTRNANGTTQLKNRNSGQCLAIGGANKEHAEAIQWPCGAGKAEQSWTIKTRTPGKRIQNKNSGLCLSNAGTLTSVILVQTACNDANHTEWHFNTLSNGFTEIRNDRSNLCLAIGKSSKDNGARAIQWTCNGAGALEQMWKVTTDGSGIEIRNVNSDKCLAIGSGSKVDGAEALQWPCGGQIDQRWATVNN